jgi:transposase
MCANGFNASSKNGSMDSTIFRDEGESPLFPPEIDDYIVKMACERPDPCGRSLSQWDCQQIASQLMRQGLVVCIGRESVRLRLKRNKLKPWRYKMWLSSKVPRDAAFVARVNVIRDLYTRPLAADEIVLCLDENTNLQPRPRVSPTLAAGIGQPVRLEHEYKRCGALNLLAAFDTRTGQVYGYLAERKRQIELIAFLNQLQEQIAQTIRTIHVVLDNVPMHTGKKVQERLAKHPRFVWYHPPVHCSWMNQVEQWFGILKRQRLRIVDFADKAALSERLQTFIAQWNERAHPFRWTSKSFDKILAKCKKEEPASEPLAQAA